MATTLGSIPHFFQFGSFRPGAQGAPAASTFTLLLPSNATFSIARAATIQAARDLYGTASAPERAITQAWMAVGVN